MTDDINDSVDQALIEMAMREEQDRLKNILGSAGSATAYFFEGLVEDGVFGNDLDTPAAIAGWFGSVFFNNVAADEEEGGGQSPE